MVRENNKFFKVSEKSGNFESGEILHFEEKSGKIGII